MLGYFAKLFTKNMPPPAVFGPATAMFVVCDDTAICADDPGKGKRTILWSDIVSVSVDVSRPAALPSPDFHWIIAGRSGRTEIDIPMGASGEDDLVRLMQRRLQGFDNMAVVEALSAPAKASFLVWEAPSREPVIRQKISSAS